MLIDLAAPRIFAFEEGKRKYTLTTKPIPEKLWLKYFAGIVSTQEVNKAGDVSNTYDSTGARLELLQAVLIDATGYTPEGQSITGIDGWQGKLPMAHRRAVGDLLTAVAAVPNAALADDEFPALGTETVTLKATWTANDAGRMHEIGGLRHIFRSPLADHQKRYSRAMSRSVVVGGSRTGQTRWLGAQDVLIEIYDELIQAVEGYTWEGSPLTVLDSMDAYHKVAAATALFTPVEIADEEALAA
jgi:hypothetical protein